MRRVFVPLVWLAPAATIAVVLWMGLAGAERAFSVGVNQSPAAVQHLAQVKGVLHEGHQSPLLPWIAPVDAALLRVIGLAVTDVGSAVNIWWLLLLMLGGTAAAWCYRRCGISITGAWVLGVLYGLSPYALYWNIEVPSVMPFLVPFAATGALAVGTGVLETWPRRDAIIIVAGNLLIGLNGGEYAYFGACLAVIAALAALVRLRRASIRSGVVTAAIVGATVASLMPGLRAPEKPPDPDFRITVADVEMSGVKIRQLIGPLPSHWLPPFAAWSRMEGAAGFPYESVNHFSRLGIVASAGFLWLFAAMLMPAAAAPPPTGEVVKVASGLTLAAFLVATVGGIGSIISLAIDPTVLAFVRVTPFFVFFALVPVGFWVDRMAIRRRRGRLIWAAVAIFALLDQMVAVRPLHRGVAKARIEYRQLHGFVDMLERQLPADARVFQLPNRSDQFYRRGVRSAPSDYLKPDQVSHRLRWRYPARTAADVSEDAPREAIAPDALPARLAQDGFAAVVVDRLGYDDNGEGVLAALQAAGRTTLLTQTDRYVALVVRR